MKAVVVTKYGTSEVIEIVERNVPSIKKNDILINIKASSISPIDIAFRTGKPYLSRLFTGLTKPKNDIPGDIVSGLVDKIGSEVTRFKVGDRVYGHAGNSFGAQGEYIALTEDAAIVKMPDVMSFETAAAFAYSAMTAMPFMEEHYEITSETKVLINGASGAIGTFAIQFAKNRGAKITAVCSESGMDVVKSLEVDEVIDYMKEDFSTSENTYDFIFDAVGKSSFNKCKRVLNKNGIYLSTMPSLGLMIRTALGIKSQSKTGKFVATGLRKNDQKIADLNKLSDYFTDGALKAVIDRTFTQAEIKEAHDFVKDGHHKGNVILRME